MLISPVRIAAALCMVAVFAILLVLAGDASSASTQKGAAKPDAKAAAAKPDAKAAEAKPEKKK